jgi:hypothetical protein
VIFSDVERLSGSGPTSDTRLEPTELHGVPVASGQDRVVFATPRVDGLWDTGCAPVYDPHDSRVVDALRALRAHRPGGAVNVWVSFAAVPENSRHVAIRQGSRIVTSGDTGDHWSTELGWLLPGKYELEVTDQRGGRFRRSLRIKSDSVTIQIEP